MCNVVGVIVSTWSKYLGKLVFICLDLGPFKKKKKSNVKTKGWTSPKNNTGHSR